MFFKTFLDTSLVVVFRSKFDNRFFVSILTESHKVCYKWVDIASSINKQHFDDKPKDKPEKQKFVTLGSKIKLSHLFFQTEKLT